MQTLYHHYRSSYCTNASELKFRYHIFPQFVFGFEFCEIDTMKCHNFMCFYFSFWDHALKGFSIGKRVWQLACNAGTKRLIITRQITISRRLSGWNGNQWHWKCHAAYLCYLSTHELYLRLNKHYYKHQHVSTHSPTEWPDFREPQDVQKPTKKGQSVLTATLIQYS